VWTPRRTRCRSERRGPGDVDQGGDFQKVMETSDVGFSSRSSKRTSDAPLFFGSSKRERAR
jgi:hypothetical protein